VLLNWMARMSRRESMSEKGLKCMPGIGNVLERISVVFVVQSGLCLAIAHSGIENQHEQ